MAKLNNRKNAMSKVLTKAFGNTDVADAKKPLLLVPIEADFTTAVRKDPKNCGLSKCVGRMFGSTLALFFRNFAYVDLVDEAGKRRAYRYILSKSARNQLIAFDRNEPVKFGISISLTPPPPKSTLVGIRTRSRRWRRSDVGKAVAAERAAQVQVRVATRDAERVQERYQDTVAKEHSSSPKVVAIRREKEVTQKALRKAREQVQAAVVKSEKLRTKSWKPGSPPQPRRFDLTVRNATGFFAGRQSA